MSNTPTLTPSLVPPRLHRKPFITHEPRHDPADPSRAYTVPLANVPLPCGGKAVLELDAFNDLMDRGFSDQWWRHSNGGRNAYVRTTHRDRPGKLFTVARCLTSGRWGTRTRYRDGDATNLRHDNLKVRDGYSKDHDAEAMRLGNLDVF